MKSLGLVATSSNPSYLALSTDKKFLLVANEVAEANNQGTVESYKIEGDKLVLLNRKPSGGAATCFVTSNIDNTVLACNYNGGNFGVLQLGANGMLSDLLDIEQHSGGYINPRQDAPHVHSAWFVPRSDEVITADLGTNELWFYTLDKMSHTLTSLPPSKLAMDHAAGPRHLCIHPHNGFLYILNELNNSITMVKKNLAGQYEKAASISTVPSTFGGTSKAADIHVSSDGKFIYASNRGHNSIAVFAVNVDGSLSQAGFADTRGQEPRNFKLSTDERYLLVANQNSNNVVCFKRDSSTGLLSYVSEIAAPSPVCILFE
jgi:6-phosphogluconolactonase